MKSLAETGRTSGLWASIGLGCSARASRMCAPHPAGEETSARRTRTRMPRLWPMAPLPLGSGRLDEAHALGQGRAHALLGRLAEAQVLRDVPLEPACIVDGLLHLPV